MKTLVVIALLTGTVATVRADYLEVWKDTPLRASPSTKAEAILNLPKGSLLTLSSEILPSPSYYAAAAPNGLNGFIARTHVRRHPGSIPASGGPSDIWVDLGDTLSPQQVAYARRHYAIGKPQAMIQRVHEGYALAHDSRLKIPLWVQYQLSREDLASKTDRKDNFRPDWFLPYGARAELSDYAGSNFDRGHMAPAADMKRSDDVMDISFLLSNMAPQVGVGFNQGIWSDLEAAVRNWVDRRGTLTVCTGPVFAPQNGQVSYRIIGANNVAVPTHFFKVVVDAQNPAKVECIAFLLPNRKIESNDLRPFIVSVDEIERLTGLDLLSALPLSIQNEIEAKPAAALW